MFINPAFDPENLELLFAHLEHSDQIDAAVITNVVSVTQYFLVDFDPHGSTRWSSLVDKFVTVGCALRGVAGLVAAVERAGVPLTAEAIGSLLHALLGFSATLYTWVDSVQEDVSAEALQLYNDTVNGIVSLLRILGGRFSNDTPPTGNISLLHSLFNGTIGSLSIILGLSGSHSYPVYFRLENDMSLLNDDTYEMQPENVKVAQIKFANQDVTYNFLCLMLQVWSSFAMDASATRWFTQDFGFRLAQYARILFERLLSGPCPLEPAPRVRLLVTTLRHSMTLGQVTGLHREIFGWNYTLLRHRIAGAAQPGWERVDAYLQEGFQSQLFAPPSQGDFLDILTSLQRCSNPDVVADVAFCFVYAVVQHSDFPVITACQDHLNRIDFGQRNGAIAELVNQRSNSQEAASRVLATQTVVEQHWRIKTRVALQEVLGTEELDWMEDDHQVIDERYISRVLEDVNAKLNSHKGEAAEWRLAMISKIHALLMTLTGQVLAPVPSLYSTFMKRMLGGTDVEATVQVRRQAFRCASQILSRIQFDADMDGLEVFKATFSGLTDDNRSVRLAAGVALKAVIGCLLKVPRNSMTLLKEVFERLHTIVDGAKLACKETLTISVGLCGELENKGALSLVLCFLVAQLRRPNPILKAEAASQLLNLTKYHQKKSPWPLLSPHMDEIAPYIIFLENQVLVEACKLMGVSLREFFDRTQRHTVPRIMMKCDRKLLTRMATVSEKTVPDLIFEEMDNVLGHIFMIENGAAYSQAIQFTTDVVADAVASGEEVTTVNVVRGYLNSVLAHLVTRMGDENPQVSQAAQTGLKRVVKVMHAVTPGRSQTLDLGKFLLSYMLAIIAHLNDKLQAVQGKISISTKQTVLRSLSMLITTIGKPIISYAPQIMATLQSNVAIPDVAEVTLMVWNDFLSTLDASEASAYFGTTTATLIYLWPSFSPVCRAGATRALDYMISNVKTTNSSLRDMVDFSHIPDLANLHRQLEKRRGARAPDDILQNILDRVQSPNFVMAIQSLAELKSFMIKHKLFMYALASGDIFDPLVGDILMVLFTSATREGDGADALRLLIFECFAILGAVDPDRTFIPARDTQMVLTSNFAAEDESFVFAAHLISDLLVGVFRSTSDTKYQGFLAYSIQELLKFGGFTPALLVRDRSSGKSLHARVRKQWSRWPKHVLETVTPLLQGRFSCSPVPPAVLSHPLYPGKATYREWIQLWTTILIHNVKEARASSIFKVLQPAINNNDVVVAHYLLPHLVLHNLISGDDRVVDNIRLEFVAVLEDQVDPNSASSSDKRLLSAQAVFMLLDHLNKWIRKIRQETSRSESRRSGNAHEMSLMRVDSVLSSINHDLMATAAFKSKAYARALMNYERQIDTLRQQNGSSERLTESYERLHEIYAQLDQPDGMEGVSAMILSPSLEHQIRQHESMGRWTSAQSCWEVRLQQDPDKLEFHLGLLRCLRNLGHYDTLSTHVRGVLTRHPTWSSALAGFQVESAWMVSAWDDVQKIVDEHPEQDSELVIARVLLAIRSNDEAAVEQSLAAARLSLGAPIVAAGGGYRRSYDSILNLHITYELEAIRNIMRSSDKIQSQRQKRRDLIKFSELLEARLQATLPTFRTREPILSMRRTAFRLFPGSRHASVETANTWLASAKIARKAGQWQTAYSAILQAEQGRASYPFIESAKLTKGSGEPLRALQELENAMHLAGFIPNGSLQDLTQDEETPNTKARSQLLRSRWTAEAQRYEEKVICEMFAQVQSLHPKWESSQFRYGQYQDECFKVLEPWEQNSSRGLQMNVVTIKCFAQAMQFGSKYVFQTVPRLLTLWFAGYELILRVTKKVEVLRKAIWKTKHDKRKKIGAWKVGDDKEKTVNYEAIQAAEQEMEEFVAKMARHNVDIAHHTKHATAMTEAVVNAVKLAPAYQWYTAFPQIVSRIGTMPDDDVFKKVTQILRTLMIRILEEYPAQAIWLFISATKSMNKTRREEANSVLTELLGKTNTEKHVKDCIQQCKYMTDELLELCDRNATAGAVFNMTKDFPRLKETAGPRTKTIIPLQDSLTAALPPSSAKHDSVHHPFPTDLPTFAEFMDKVEVFNTMAKPRKITVRGSDGHDYMFLGKPKDDLRKDARLMEFNGIINKLLNSNSESRRRQLHIRTYAVVTLNEECGFIQWVPNTATLRPIIIRMYNGRMVAAPKLPEVSPNHKTFHMTKFTTEADALIMFNYQMAIHKPVLHHWFVETFPEPSVWLAARLNYARTAAVMSMVGFILGLGDRHCENILVDVNSGELVHVDLNCLFEKGKLLEVAERVPFRLTQNIVDGLGVTGVEGVFRVSCEVVFEILRNNREPLMSVLDAFVHDPLGEFTKTGGTKAPTPTPEKVARDTLLVIDKKLRGIYSTGTIIENRKKELSTKNLVQLLILEATSISNLSRMYHGWVPWH